MRLHRPSQNGIRRKTLSSVEPPAHDQNKWSLLPHPARRCCRLFSSRTKRDKGTNHLLHTTSPNSSRRSPQSWTLLLWRSRLPLYLVENTQQNELLAIF